LLAAASNRLQRPGRSGRRDDAGGCHAVTQAPNDKEQVVPMLEVLEAQSAVLGTVERMIADTGFCSEKNILACEEAHLEPLIAVARDEHHPGWRERHSEPALLRDNATPMQSMAHRLKSKAGRALYALRKQTVEPVFGIIKSVMGFRQFSFAAQFSKWREGELAKAHHRLDDADTGSTVLFAQGVKRSPRFDFRRCAMLCIGVALSRKSAGSLWRSRQPGWCSSRATAISGSRCASSHAKMSSRCRSRCRRSCALPCPAPRTALEYLQHRHNLFLVMGACVTRVATTSIVAASTAAWAL